MAGERLPCRKCGKEYADLQDHIKKIHGNERWTARELVGTDLIACACGQPCKSQLGMIQHQKKRQCEGYTPGEGMKKSCPNCGQKTASLLQHILSSRHAQTVWRSADLVAVGLALCPCGVPVQGASHLARHRNETRCSEWRVQQALTAARSQSVARSQRTLAPATTHPTTAPPPTTIPLARSSVPPRVLPVARPPISGPVIQHTTCSISSNNHAPTPSPPPSTPPSTPPQDYKRPKPKQRKRIIPTPSSVASSAGSVIVMGGSRSPIVVAGRSYAAATRTPSLPPTQSLPVGPFTPDTPPSPSPVGKTINLKNTIKSPSPAPGSEVQPVESPTPPSRASQSVIDVVTPPQQSTTPRLASNLADNSSELPSSDAARVLPRTPTPSPLRQIGSLSCLVTGSNNDSPYIPNNLGRSVPDAAGSGHSSSSSSDAGSDHKGSVDFRSFYDRYLDLASLSTTNKALSPDVAAAFKTTAERIAAKFVQQPNSEHLYEFLALPKTGLAPGLRPNGQIKKRLKDYPCVDHSTLREPEVVGEVRDRPAGNEGKTATKCIEQGQLSRASRVLADNSKVLPVNEAVLEKLKSQHPTGTPSQAFGYGVGPPASSCPGIDTIEAAMKSFRKDTSSGISGWTHHLLLLALQTESVQQMVRKICSLMLAGDCPGQEMLCSARLTPLAKPNGGVRPIAVGELLSRLCSKMILRHSLKPGMTLDYQFGVGSKGGVEPIIHAAQRSIDKEEGFHFTHLTSLDFSNAFNTLDRKDVAEGIKKFAPGLFRLGRWAYGSENGLVLVDNDRKAQVVTSSQGVRQGDPFGPLFFSVGIASLLQRLQQHLGNTRCIMAYLDDIIILSNDSTTLNDVEAFFTSSPSSLKLNLEKSKMVALQDAERDGLEILGSCVGGPAARERFLLRKVQEQEPILAKLSLLPSQHALLLLRQSLQQNLRHLLRCLKTSDIPDAWSLRDTSLLRSVTRLRRSAGNGLASFKTRVTTALPTKMGGLGILSHWDCAPHAFASSKELSDQLLYQLPTIPGFQEPANVAVAPTLRSQRDRCQDMFKKQAKDFAEFLDPVQRRMLAEHSSYLGRRWLSVIPFNASLSLSDREISGALHARTLQDPSDSTCLACGQLNPLGHNEVCLRVNQYKMARHEVIKKILYKSLSSSGAFGEVHMEPLTAEGGLRTDLRYKGARESGTTAHEFDITVVSMAARTFLPGHSDAFWELDGSKQNDWILQKKAEQKVSKYKGLVGDAAGFTPLVFGLGGGMEAETHKIFQGWREVLSISSFEFMLRRISIVLVRARFSGFQA